MMYQAFLLTIPLLMVFQTSCINTSPLDSVKTIEQARAPKVSLSRLGELRNRAKFIGRSCKEVKDRYGQAEDGLYYLTTSTGVVYQTFCDMTTAGGGWTLVASVHEDNIYGKCTVGDRWTSQQGNNANWPKGEGNWANRKTFGTVEAATDDDFKNPGYYDIDAEDMSVWHVPNKTPFYHWNLAAIMRYHTERRFLHLYGGNLYYLFHRYPVEYNVGAHLSDNGPSIPIVYDLGDKESTKMFYGPNTRGETEGGFISFRAINHERAATAICSGVKPKGGEVDAYCIGGGGFFPQGNPLQCGDFTSFAWNGYGTNVGWSASKQMLESAVLLFYR
ncbi:intelectin-like [Salmo salar]|uniref:Intelectin-like n=1 Tax=Salmo salar TaxID=8030 RepID=A0A1S3Q075_SALSA|nr:intelectin-like [Salmo salar]|eukprot:XP_014033281.1 PREDICTED: intelectin-like [Salmo salar]